MEQLITDGLWVGAITVLLCTSEIAQRLRDFVRPRTKVLECCFCTSWWVSLLVDPSMTLPATVAVGNIAVLLIHWSLSTYQTEEDQT